jgi:hypothetical protein
MLKLCNFIIRLIFEHKHHTKTLYLEKMCFSKDHKGITIIIYKIALCSLLTMTLSCNSTQEPSIEGIWIEHWVNQIVPSLPDSIILSFQFDSLIIQPKNTREYYNPKYLNINFNESELTYTMINNGFSNKYRLHLVPDELIFKGYIETWRGETVKIELRKVVSNP